MQPETITTAIVALEYVLQNVMEVSEAPEIYVDYTWDEFESCVKEALADLEAERAAQTPQAQVALDTPDGSGDWWFNGTGSYASDLPVYTIQERVRVIESNDALIAICEDINGKGLMFRAVGDMHGKWWRVVMPWEPRPAAPDAMPQGIMPNWDHAPNWAHYWTRDENGRGMWWEFEPYFSKAHGIWIDESEGKRTYATNNPTLRTRPATTQPPKGVSDV